MSGRELVIDAGMTGSGRFPSGVLYDAHFTETDFYLTLSKGIPARDRDSPLMQWRKQEEHIRYDHVRSITMSPRGGRILLARNQGGEPAAALVELPD